MTTTTPTVTANATATAALLPQMTIPHYIPPQPSSWGAEDPLDVVYRYISPSAQRVRIIVSIEPSEDSEDGVHISLRRNRDTQNQRHVTSSERLIFKNIALEEGDEMDVVLGPNQNARGDFTRLRVTVEREDDNV